MRLSEAIREGSKKRPQYFGAYFGNVAINLHGMRMASCAIGAAYEGSFGTPRYGTLDVLADLTARYPEMETVETTCPACGVDDYLGDLLWHLNDDHTWTREAIADWLDSMTLEPMPAPAHARRRVDMADAAAREDVWHD